MFDASLLRAWIALISAIVLEVAGTAIMKGTQSAASLWPMAGVAVMLACVTASYWLLAKAAQRIPIGAAYACWEGLGLALITLCATLLGETLTLRRILALLAVLAGILCIHWGTGHGPSTEHAEAQS